MNFVVHRKRHYMYQIPVDLVAGTSGSINRGRFTVPKKPPVQAIERKKLPRMTISNGKKKWGKKKVAPKKCPNHRVPRKYF